MARPAGHERFPNAPTRPLGQSNTVDALYFHTQLAVGDFLCFSNAPARGWTDIALVGMGNLADLGAVAERLRETAGSEAAALIGRVVDEEAAAQLIAAANATANAAAGGPTVPARPTPAPTATAIGAAPEAPATATPTPVTPEPSATPAKPAAPRRANRHASRPRRGPGGILPAETTLARNSRHKAHQPGHQRRARNR